MSFALLTPPDASDSGPARRAFRDAVAAPIADPDVTRLIVAPQVSGPQADAQLAGVIAALMCSERLEVEVAYAAPEPTPATGVYGLPHGAAARELAENGVARPLPLMRDDAATVLVGRARHLGEDGAKLHGESYVDDHRLFNGDVRGIEIEPTIAAPGLRARLLGRTVFGRELVNRERWYPGRAVQTGGTNIVVEREGVLTTRPVKRSTYYRHHVDLLLVTPAPVTPTPVTPPGGPA